MTLNINQGNKNIEIGFGLFYTPENLDDHPTAAFELYEKITKQVQIAEGLGWKNVWLAEHHGVPFGGIINAPEILGAYIASQTSRIRIGPAISVLPFHDPRVLAERYAMLDQLSKGRLDMGIGRGFLAKEFEIMGIAPSESKARFKEAQEVLMKAWSGKPLNFEGEFFSYTNAQCFPQPYQQSHPPIWLAASKSSSSFELAGHNAYNLMINPYTREKEEVIEGIAIYRAALKKSGKDSAKCRIAAVQHLYLGEIDQTLITAFNRYVHTLVSSATDSVSNGVDWKKHFESIGFDGVYPEKVLFGTVEEVASRIQQWIALGVTDFCFVPQFGDLPWEISLRTIKAFQQVINILNTCYEESHYLSK